MIHEAPKQRNQTKSHLEIVVIVFICLRLQLILGSKSHILNISDIENIDMGFPF